jgi:hypothetical protein
MSSYNFYARVSDKRGKFEVVRPETRLAAAGFKRGIGRWALRLGIDRLQAAGDYGAGRWSWAVALEVGASRRFCLGDEVDAAENGGWH